MIEWIDLTIGESVNSICSLLCTQRGPGLGARYSSNFKSVSFWKLLGALRAPVTWPAQSED